MVKLNPLTVGRAIRAPGCGLRAKSLRELALDLAPHKDELLRRWSEGFAAGPGTAALASDGDPKKGLKTELILTLDALEKGHLDRLWSELARSGEECARAGLPYEEVMMSFQIFKECCTAILQRVFHHDPVGLLKRYLILDRFAFLRLRHLAEAYFTTYLLLLQEKNQELLSAREQHARHLVRAEKLAALGQLAAGVAHELNNPLATIANYAEEMLDLTNEGPQKLASDADAVAHHLESVKSQIYRCKKITQDLLDLARTKAPHLDEVRLEDIIRRVVDVAGYQREAANLISVKIDPDLPRILSDPFQIEQIFMNLLRNAIDAVGPTGRIQVLAQAAGDRVVVEIQDDGCGIPPELMDRIFDPFFTTKPAGKGTGLGLAICYTLLQKLGGEISLASSPGKGTTARVVLPVEVGVS